MAEESTGYDIAGGIGEVPWAVMSPLLGASVPIVGSYGALFVRAGSAAMTVDVLSGVTYAFGQRWYISTTTNKTIAPVTLAGAIRWDAVVIHRDWSSNSTTVVVVPGTAAVNAPMVNPAGLNNSPGVQVDQVLALVKATNGSTALDIRDRRVYSSQLSTVATADALPTPTTSLYGAAVYVVDQKKTFRCLVVTGSAAWVPDAATRQVARGTDLLSPASGWSLASSSQSGAATLASRGTYDPASGDVQIDLQMRRSGAAISASASGNSDDTPICTLASPFLPDPETSPMPVALQYASGSGAANSWLDAEATLDSAGVLMLVQLTSNVDLAPPTAGASVRMHLTFTKINN